jgi:5-formyltetrahydrofolate cyclo-ligase
VEIAEQKARLRAEMSRRRRAVPADVAQVAAVAVAARVAELPVFGAARRVALYASLPDELPTRPLFERIVLAGKAACLPRLADRGLEFVSVPRWEDLREGRYGLRVPPPDLPAVESLDLVLLPGVAFDRRGRRLGRGGAHYDRTFADRPTGGPMLIGVAYAFQVVDEVPSEDWDRDVDAVVSERECHWVRERA